MTSRDRVLYLYPATGTTKVDVIRYYAEASAAMLPEVQGRPAGDEEALTGGCR